MTKEEAIAYCYRNRDQYIRDSDSIDDGIRQFDCLIAIVEDGTIAPEQLAEYGMDYEEAPLKDVEQNGHIAQQAQP